MQPAQLHECGCPSQASLGDDLLTTTPYQRRLALARPLIALFAYALAARAGFWIATPFLVFLIFVSVVTVTHDVVHGSLGLSRRQTDWALFWLGAVLLESGHANRATHLQHHAVFPGPNDPEGDPARMSFWRAVLYGPIFLLWLWCWAFMRQRHNRAERRWLLAEAGWALFIILLGGCLICRGTPPFWPTPCWFSSAVGSIRS